MTKLLVGDGREAVVNRSVLRADEAKQKSAQANGVSCKALHCHSGGALCNWLSSCATAHASARRKLFQPQFQASLGPLYVTRIGNMLGCRDADDAQVPLLVMLFPTKTTRTALNAAVIPKHSALLMFVMSDNVVEKRKVKAMRAPIRARAELMKKRPKVQIEGISEDKMVLAVLTANSTFASE